MIHRTLFRYGLLGFCVTASEAAAQETATIEVSKTPLTSSIAYKPGPPPTGLSVTGTPASATVTWQPAAGAVSYSVERFLEKDPACCTIRANDLTQTTWTDLGANGTGGLQWAGNYVYRVYVNYGDRSIGQADITWTRPDPVNPPVVNRLSSGAAGVRLFWDVVPNASYYMVWGDGLPSTGQQVGSGDATRTAFRTRTQLPGLYVSGLVPGMGSWTVGSFYSPGPVSTPAAQFTKVVGWVTGAAGFVPPRMPAPTFQATEFNALGAAFSDWDGVVMTTNIPQEAVQGTCPTDVMVFLDGSTEPIRAANYYRNSTSTDYQFTNLNGSLYFRAPNVASITTAPTAPNSYIYAVNCKGEYTNALPFKIWPSDLHIESVTPTAAFFGGSKKFWGSDQGSIAGWGMKGRYSSSSQKVVLRAVFQRGSQTMPVEKELAVWSLGERSLGITAPVLTTLASSNMVLTSAKIVVIKDGIESNAIPICFNSDSKGITVMAYDGCPL